MDTRPGQGLFLEEVTEMDKLVLPDRVFNLRHITRPDSDRGLQGVHITRKYAEATNGYALVRIAFSAKEQAHMSEAKGLPPAKGCGIRFVSGRKPLRKASSGQLDKWGKRGRKPTDDMLLLVSCGKGWMADPERATTVQVLPMDFPPVGDLIKREDKVKRRKLGLDPQLIVACQKAVGVSYRTGATIYAAKDILNPYKVELHGAKDATCYVMAMAVG